MRGGRRRGRKRKVRDVEGRPRAQHGRSGSTADTGQYHLRHCALQIAREAGPGAAAVGAELTAKALGGKTKQLPQEVVSFGVDGTSGLEHEGGEEEGLMMKASVVLLVLPSGILITGAQQPHRGRRERTGDSDIDGHAFAGGPDRNRNIPGATARSGTQNTLLLHDRAEKGVGGDHEVADSVVPDDQIS